MIMFEKSQNGFHISSTFVNNLISEDIQLILMRGIQGSGKSTFANNLKSIIDGFGISEAIITSADNYFIRKKWIICI